MNKNKLIADLLIPNLKNERGYYEKVYSKRNLKPGAEVTRYAPSPTGFMHIGNFLSALIDNKVAQSTGGIFFVRIEDTDQKREIQGAKEAIFQILKRMNISIDEGNIGENFSEVGEYGPYTQSERKDIYLAYAKWMLEKGRAYPCFCSAEKIQSIRQRQKESKEPTGYYGEYAHCRNLSYEEIEQKIKNKENFTIRLKSDGKIGDLKKIEFKDEIRGERSFPANFIDSIIIKTNKLPLYNFAHAVDDHLMGTTLVVRGEEWIPSLAEHLEIFDSLEIDRLRYAHTPLIQKLDNGHKRKISKRKDPEADMRFYFKEGYTPEAVIEYLLTIANSNYEQWRDDNRDKDISEFNFRVDKLGSNSPLIDIDKLNNISKTIISEMTPNEILENTIKWAGEHNKSYEEILKRDLDYSLKVYSIESNNDKKRKDIYKWSMLENFYSFMFSQPDSELKKLLLEKGDRQDIINILNDYKSIYNYEDEKSIWFDKIKDLGAPHGYAREVKEWKKNKEKFKGHCGDVSTIIRVAITGKDQTPDLYEILFVLGEHEIKERLTNAINILESKQNWE